MKTEYKTSTLHQTEKRKEKEKMETEGKKRGKGEREETYASTSVSLQFIQFVNRFATEQRFLIEYANRRSLICRKMIEPDDGSLGSQDAQPVCGSCFREQPARTESR